MLNLRIETIPTVDLLEFAKQHGLVLVIRERRIHDLLSSTRYYAKFENAEIGEDGVLIGTFGNGASPLEAARAYARKISLKHLVIEAFTEHRRGIDAPRLKVGHEEPSLCSGELESYLVDPNDWRWIEGSNG